MAINCKDLPIRPHRMAYSVESGRICLENMLCETMCITRTGDTIEIDGTNWKWPLTFKLKDKNVKIMIGENSFSICNMNKSGYARGIYRIGEHQKTALQDLKRLLEL